MMGSSQTSGILFHGRFHGIFYTAWKLAGNLNMSLWPWKQIYKASVPSSFWCMYSSRSSYPQGVGVEFEEHIVNEFMRQDTFPSSSLSLEKLWMLSYQEDLYITKTLVATALEASSPQKSGQSHAGFANQEGWIVISVIPVTTTRTQRNEGL